MAASNSKVVPTTIIVLGVTKAESGNVSVNL